MTWGNFEQVAIDAPTGGFVLVNASVTLMNSCASGCFVYGAIERSDVALADTIEQQVILAAEAYETMSMTRVIPVEAGQRTLQVRLMSPDAPNLGIAQDYGQISAIFSAFGESHS